MQSTPAVFCNAMASLDSTPFIPNQSIEEQGSYPWAVKTPEDSPICMEMLPAALHGDIYQQGPVESGIPRDQLQSVCKPFFDQMVAVMQHSLQTQMHPGNQLMDIAEAMTQSSFHWHYSSKPCSMSHVDPSLDEESTEADDTGAFTCLLSSPPSEGDSMDAETKFSEADVFRPLSEGPDAEESVDLEKSNMVCRHWKTKGFCRLGENCKFLHPEHKRGVALVKGGKRGVANSGDISGTGCPDMNTETEATTARRKRRGGRNRSNKSQHFLFCNPEENVMGLQTYCYSLEYPSLVGVPCISVV